MLLIDGSSSGRPTVTPASAGYSMRSRRIRCGWRRSCWPWHLNPVSGWAVVHVLGEPEIDRAEIDGAEATRGLILTRIDVDLRDGRHERFDAIEPRDRAEAAVAALGIGAP